MNAKCESEYHTYWLLIIYLSIIHLAEKSFSLFIDAIYHSKSHREQRKEQNMNFSYVKWYLNVFRVQSWTPESDHCRSMNEPNQRISYSFHNNKRKKKRNQLEHWKHGFHFGALGLIGFVCRTMSKAPVCRCLHGFNIINVSIHRSP